MRDFRDAKAMARSLREGLAGKGRTITNSEALELVARMMGERDWNTLSAAIEKARLGETAWTRSEAARAEGEAVTGRIVERVRGGFSVDLDGASGFLPGSQLDIRPVRDLAGLIGERDRFVILAMDRAAGNIVVSRRALRQSSAQA